MKRAAIAGFAAGLAMAVGGALGAVSNMSDARPVDPSMGVMNPMIAGQAMLASRDVMENLAASPVHTRLTTALRESGIAGALKSNGQFTLFAPTDSAFNVEGARNKAQLAHRIGYLVVPGKYDSASLLQLINQSGGDARLRTVDGGILIARMNGPTNITLMDERGRTANIAIYDVHNRNGVIMVVDAMSMPSGAPRQIALAN
jgi:uncharacterized surface protein with fasciclin (FAS1) repeats